jgi:hypothetical protein
MTDFRASERDVNRAIRSWLREDRHEDVSRVAGAVLDQVDTIPQRRVTWWPARRTAAMNKTLTFGLGAAAVVVLALLLGSQLLAPPGGTGGPGEEASPSPEASTVPPTPGPSPSSEAGLPEGPHLLGHGEGIAPSLTVTIPGPGWEGDVGGGILFWHGDKPDEVGMIVFTEVDEYYVFGDPCNWESTNPDTPVRTVDEFVAALAAQPGRDASAPVDITIDGYTGKAITLQIPDDADFSECDQNSFGTWNCGDPAAPIPCGFNEPGETSVEYIVDVEGTLVAWHMDYRADTPAENVAEAEELVLSATFGE